MQQVVLIHAVPIHALATDESCQRWLILWPGLGGTAEQFMALLEAAPDLNVGVLALDPPGHGRTPPWPGNWTWPDVESVWEAALNWVQARGAQQSTVGGHSYGAYAAVMAARDPRVGACLLLDGGYLEPFPSYDRASSEAANAQYLASREFPSWDAYLASERAETKHWDHRAEVALRAAMREDNGVVRPVITLATANAVSHLLSTLHVAELPYDTRPTLLLTAGEPAQLLETRREGALAFRERHPQTSVVVVPDSGHDLLLDNPRVVLAAIKDFLQR